VIVQKALKTLAGLIALAAAAGVAVVASGFALFAFLEQYLTPAAAAALVAGVAALGLAIGGWLITRKPGRRDTRKEEGGLAERLIGMARERPIVVAACAIGVGLVAIRNPQLLTALLTAAIAREATPRKR
jgi:hypothetical protein